MAVEGNMNGEDKAHVKSYSLFDKMFKWGAVISFILAMFVVFVLIA